MPQRLPSRPNLGHLKKQAKDVLRVSRHRGPRWCLADAQQAVAHGYGFPGWPELKVHVESLRQQLGPESSARRVPEDAAAHDVSAISHAAIQDRGRSSHPIAGTWATRPTAPGNGAHVSTGDMVVEFELTDDGVTLTQIVEDPAGRRSAIKTSIQADGQDHSVPFGHELVLQAAWTDSRTIELIFKQAETIVGKWTYEVSVDGQSLIVSTGEQVLVFERV